ncbi:ABC transporter permease [Candidatus Latescibacterota bacterium]
MRKILRLARREYSAAVRTKGFIIGLVLAPILMSGGFIAFKISEANVDISDKKLVVIDHSGVIADAILAASKARDKNEVFDKDSGKKVKPAYPVEVIAPDTDEPLKQRLGLSDRIRKGELHAFLEIGAAVVHPSDDPPNARISYYSKNAMVDDLRGWVGYPINSTLRKLRLTDAGIEDGQIRDLFNWIRVDGLGLVTRDAETGVVKDAKRSGGMEAVGVPIFLMMLMYMMILMGSTPLLSSVVEEKTQRIAEVLLGSIKPFGFMIGKIMGGVGMALTASSVYIFGAIISVIYMDLLDTVPYNLLPWFFTYLILALFMYGSIFTAIGSACNDMKDVQALAMPAMMPIIFAMILIGPVIKQPTSSFAMWISLIPPFTPLLMTLRMGIPGGVPLWQPIAGVILVLATTIATVWAGGRIFRVGILMQGASPKLRTMIKWAIRG